MNNFIPHIFLGIGAQNHLFTLRKTYLKTINVGFGKTREVVSSFHIQNLAQNRDDAMAKAQAYAVENAVIFKPDADLPSDLEEIRRCTREEAELRERRRQEEIQAQRDAYAQAKLERRHNQERQLEAGIFSFGQHEGKKIEDYPGYAAFLVSKKDEFEKGSILEFAANVIETRHLEMLEEEQFKPGHRPEAEKTRITIKGKVKRVIRFQNCFDGYHTTTSYMVFIRDENGLCIVAKGSWYAEEGTEVNITASLKSKDAYKGQDQTVVNRVKVV